jgi:predicted metal-dependent hydrolase
MISYELRRSKRRTISVEIQASAIVIVRAPMRLPLIEVERFLALRQTWISAQLQKLDRRRAVIPQRTHEQQFYHRGGLLTWGWQGADVPVPKRVATVPAAQRWIEGWQRDQAQVLFEEMLRDYVPSIGVHGLRYAGLKLRKMKRRWGSCTRTGIITLNEHLIRVPDACIRGVIVHELCHLVHMDHGKQFRQLVADVYPEHKLADELLDCWTSVLGAGADLVEG